VLLDDLADYLTSQGGSGVGAVYAGTFPPTAADAALAIYEYPGQPSVHHMAALPGQAVVERPCVQVVARGSAEGYQAARTRLHNAFVLLDGLRDRTINGTRYLWVASKGTPFPLGPDETKRLRIAANFDVMKNLSTSTST
jgi:hypothetical protein